MTYNELKEKYANIPITRPFAWDDPDKELPKGNSFSKSYSIPISNGGLRLTRHHMNALGFLSTLGTYLDSYGYQPEWRDLSAIGGYPQGAVVSKIDSNGIKKYVSLKDNNTNEPQFEDILTDESGEENGWKPLFKTKEYNFFPDYESKEKIWEYHVTPSLPLNFTTIEITSPGWILMERRIDNWDEVVVSTANESLRNSWDGYYNYVEFVPYKATLTDLSDYSIKINLTEGPLVSRFYPCNNGFAISGSCSRPVSGMTISVYLFKMEDA
ncbi:MAG: hypothetical protein J6Q22_10900 [Prevotella sp.]|nr:hypothetical protein [Prevotella sp.]